MLFCVLCPVEDVLKSVECHFAFVRTVVVFDLPGREIVVLNTVIQV